MAQRANPDYPPEAVKNGWEGIVTFRALIGTDGRAKNCEIIQSSGYAILDDAACRKVIDTARFESARDERGRAIEDYYQSRFVWELD